MEELLDPYAKFKKHNLPYGYTLQHAYVKRPYVYIEFIVHAGGFDDPKGKEGLAHFVEHMFHQNGPLSDDSTHKHFKKNKGFALLGSTDITSTNYKFKIASEPKHVKKALKLYFATLFSIGDLSGFDSQMKIIADEYLRKHPRPLYDSINDKIQKYIYGDTYWGRTREYLGTAKSIPTITKADVFAFWKKYYQPENISIVAYGGISASELKKLISEEAGRYESLYEAFTPREIGKSERILVPESGKGKLFELSRRKAFGSNSVNKGVAIYNAIVMLPDSLPKRAIGFAKLMVWKKINKIVREKWHATYGVSTQWVMDTTMVSFKIVCKSFDAAYRDQIIPSVYASIKEAGNDEKLFRETKQGIVQSYYSADENCEEIFDNATKSIESLRRVRTTKEQLNEARQVRFSEVKEVLAYLTPENMIHTLVG